MKRWRAGMGWWDWPLLLAYAALAAFGVAFAYSASPDYAYWQGLDPLFFFRRQVLFTGVAVVALLAATTYSTRLPSSRGRRPRPRRGRGR